MDLGLQGKVALITGASRGIGLGIASTLAAEGCRLVLCARGDEALQAAAADLRNNGAEVEAIACDVTESGAAGELVAAAVERFGGIDIVVGNVGGNRRGALEDTTDDDWDAVIQMNLLSHVRTARAAIPHMRGREGASILFISSIFGREAGGAGLSIYNSTKSALISMAKIMALELAKDGIRVNTVAPGSIRFPGGSWDTRCIQDPEGMERFVASNIPMGRFGTVEEVANLATFLSSPRASWISGACVNVDGLQSRSLI